MRFVDQQDFGPVGGGTGDRQALALGVAEPAGRRVGLFGQPHPGQQFGDVALVVGRPSTDDAGNEAGVVPDR